MGNITPLKKDVTQRAINYLVYLGVKTCEVFLCFVAIVRVRSIMLSVTGFYTEDEPNYLNNRDSIATGYQSPICTSRLQDIPADMV